MYNAYDHLPPAAPIGHCVQIWRGIPWLYVIAIPATSLLFFFRVRAMYGNNLYVTLFFSFMLLAVVAGSVTSTQGVTLVPIGTTNYCTNGRMDEYVIASGIIPLVNDTLVFIAITWRLVRGSVRVPSTRTGGSWSFIFGKHLPAFSRSLLQDGQVYYLLSDFKIYYFQIAMSWWHAFVKLVTGAQLVSPSCRWPLFLSNPFLLFIVQLSGFRISCWSTSWHVVYTEIPSSGYSERQLAISTYRRRTQISPLYSMEAILPRSAAHLTMMGRKRLKFQFIERSSWLLISRYSHGLGSLVIRCLSKFLSFPTTCVVMRCQYKIAANGRIERSRFGLR